MRTLAGSRPDLHKLFLTSEWRSVISRFYVLRWFLDPKRSTAYRLFGASVEGQEQHGPALGGSGACVAVLHQPLEPAFLKGMKMKAPPVLDRRCRLLSEAAHRLPWSVRRCALSAGWLTTALPPSTRTSAKTIDIALARSGRVLWGLTAKRGPSRGLPCHEWRAPAFAKPQLTRAPRGRKENVRGNRSSPLTNILPYKQRQESRYRSRGLSARGI